MSNSAFYKQFSFFDEETSLKRKAIQKIFGPTRYEKMKKEWNSTGKNIYDIAYVPWLETKIPNWQTYYSLIEGFRGEWKDKRESGAADGSDTHSNFEATDLETGLAVQELTGEVFEVRQHGKKPDGTNCSAADSLADLGDGFYGELLMWVFFPFNIYVESIGEEVCGIAGTADRVFKRKNTVAIEDYKTNKKFSDFAIKIPNYGYTYHFPPYQMMAKTDISNYKIQLNTYGWMCKQHGLEVTDLRLLHTPKGIIESQVKVNFEPHLVDLAVSNMLNFS